jgi:hypothetical protein
MIAAREQLPRPASRQVQPIDAKDGPWTISVAENPHHSSSYTLYIKSEYPLTKTLSENFVALLYPVVISHIPFHFVV